VNKIQKHVRKLVYKR